MYKQHTFFPSFSFRNLFTIQLQTKLLRSFITYVSPLQRGHLFLKKKRWVGNSTHPSFSPWACTFNKLPQTFKPYSTISETDESSSSSSLLGNAFTLLEEPHLLRYLNKLDQRVIELPLLLQKETDPHLLAEWNKELKHLQPLIQLYHQFCKSKKLVEELSSYLEDPELKGLALQDHRHQLIQLKNIAQQLLLQLIPPLKEDEAECAVLELRAGVGGNEAALFAKQLYSMYALHAQYQAWKWEDTHISWSDAGGYKEATATVTGPGVFRKLKFESGVHRVQRVPETESMGRMHTSAVTVAILPFVEEVNSIDIPLSDLRIDVFRASGPGGQHVNKTESAVRLTHLPTGTTVSVQDERSQHKNKAKAMKILKTKLLVREQTQQRVSRHLAKKQQMGIGDRSERVRTYHFPQNRVTDHRVPITVHGVDAILEGGNLFCSLVDALLLKEDLERLAKLGKEEGV